MATEVVTMVVVHHPERNADGQRDGGEDQQRAIA
jgi:hypothetical protein